jgi:hypothetical protein
LNRPPTPVERFALWTLDPLPSSEELTVGILSDFFIADANSPLSPRPSEREEGDICRLKSITPLEAARLLAVLRGASYSANLIREFRLVSPEDAEDWTMSVPLEMVHALADISDHAAPEFAANFSEITRAELKWTPEDWLPIVKDLTALARRALQSNKSMFLWNSL